MQSLQETIILKASFNEDIRRVKLSSFDFITLQNQISQLFSLGDLNSFVLKYRDDEGDMISIFTNEELQEAISFDQKILRIYVSLKDQPKKRIHKKRVKKNNKKAENIPNNTNNTPGFRDILNDPNVDPFAFIQPLYQNLFQEGKINDIIQNVITNDYSETINEFLPFFSTQNNNNNNSQPEKVLHNAFCDRCDKRIEGLRWKCFDCSDFDYCNECYIVAHGNEDKKTHLKTHVFGMMENPCSTSNYQQEKEKHLEKLRIEKEKQEKERLEKEKLENERKEKEEKEKQEKERLEKERKEKEEKERQNKEEEEKKKIDQEKIVYPFEQKLQDLQNMGFVDRKRNIQILIKHKGSISHAIQELLDSN